MEYVELANLIENNKQTLAIEWAEAALAAGFSGTIEQINQGTIKAFSYLVQYIRTGDVTEWRNQVSASASYALKLNIAVEKELEYLNALFDILNRFIERNVENGKDKERYLRRLLTLKTLTVNTMLAVMLRPSNVAKV